MDMTSAPDPADVSGPDLPRDPADYAPRRRGLGAAFWAMIAFGVLCAVAGGIIGRYGPEIFPKKPTSAPAASPAAAPPAQPTTAALAPSLGAVAPAPSAPGGDVGALTARLDRLQVDQRRIADASAAALAVATLSQASDTSRPFADQLASVQRLLPDSAELRALQPLAQAGAPSRASLAAELARLADRVSVASRAPAADAGVLARLGHLLASIFVVRRIDGGGGKDPDAVLARAQRAIDEGDLDGALRETASLPPAGRDALADWRAQAERRDDIDRLVAAIRAGAARDLAQAAGQAPAT